MQNYNRNVMPILTPMGEIVQANSPHRQTTKKHDRQTSQSRWGINQDISHNYSVDINGFQSYSKPISKK